MSNNTVPTPANPAGWKFETRQIHAGQAPDAATGARALPIYQTTSFVFENAEQAANRFALAELGPIYTRLNNPTQEVIENRIASLEGGVGALLVASGQSAITYAILNIAGAGDHIVASPSIYGGTYNLLKYTLADLGVETTFIENPDDVQQWREAVRPIEFGADVVVHSATKYLGGHGTSIGGVIVDSGNFDYGADPKKFPKFNEPAPSYHGLVYARDLGKDSAFGANLSYILKARVSLLRDTGAAISPTNAFNIGIGLETLSLRIERHIENATKVANWLEEHPLVDRVIWAGLPSSPWYERAQKYLPKGPGAVVGFTLKDADLEQTRTFVDALQLHSNVANIGDVRSLVIHPASTTHSQLSEEELEAIGVSKNFVRLAVGIENIDDIIADLELGFATLQQ